jgi:hypothetical protein
VPGASVFIQALNLGTTRRHRSYTFSVPASRVTGQTVQLTARWSASATDAAITLGGGTITQNFTLASAPAAAERGGRHGAARCDARAVGERHQLGGQLGHPPLDATADIVRRSAARRPT